VSTWPVWLASSFGRPFVAALFLAPLNFSTN
jgi:hypothetical protein